MLSPVHPRGCGEYCVCASSASAFCGSSPRVRGIRHLAHESPANPRFIPAGAGNTLSSPSSPIHAPVHPRGCGEYPHWRVPRTPTTGSSPRVRGIQFLQAARRMALRFIPAGAGNTLEPPSIRHQHTVHPRGCGEYMWSGSWVMSRTGSSPRVRGIPDRSKSNDDVLRFIPAGAGNTLCRLTFGTV